MADIVQSNVIRVAFHKRPTDGGKARILARRKAVAEAARRYHEQFGDLAMDHADPALEMPSDAAP